MTGKLLTLAICALLCAPLSYAQSLPGDADGDGIGDETESRVLGNGDGNRDGIADVWQSNVASFSYLPSGIRGGSREGTLSNTELAPNRGAGGLSQVRVLEWSELRTSALAEVPPLQFAGRGDALLVQIEYHGALVEGGRFYWAVREATSSRTRPSFVDVLGSAEQSGSTWVLSVEDNALQDLDRRVGEILVVGFPR